MIRLGNVILGVVLGLGLALLVRPWVSGPEQPRRATAPTVVGGF